MRILLIPLYYELHKKDPMAFDGMEQGFRHWGHEAVIYDGNIDSAIANKPDIILFQGSVSLAECKLLKGQTNAIFAMYTGDCRYTPMPSLMEYREIVDVYLLPFSGELLNNYTRLLLKKCAFLWEAIQNWRFKGFKPLDTGKITFVGNAYEHFPADRIALSNFLTKHVTEFECYGSLPHSKGMFFNYDLPELYQNSFAVIAENNLFEDSYFTPRNIGSMAAGSCALMRWFPNIERFFTNWKDCIIYKSYPELLDIVSFLKVNPDVRNRIAKAGHELADNNYRYENWAELCLKLLKDTTN